MIDKKTSSKKIDFGFEEIPIEEKQQKVKDVFNSVASKYDIMNDVMSLGLHRLWKRNFVAKIKPRQNIRILDLASGTGDIAFAILQKLQDSNIQNYEIVISDINNEMLKIAQQKAVDKNLLKNIEFKIINGEEIPFEDNSFDYCTIAFGIRNITHRNKALKEIYRVLKPMGKFLCLEFSKPEGDLYNKIYDFYSFNLIPKIGKIIANDDESYKYLVESIRKFPSADEFQEIIESENFIKTSYQKLNNGLVAIHSGYKV